MRNGIRIILDDKEYDFPKSKLEALLLLAFERVGGNAVSLANHIGVTKAAVSLWKQGKRKLVGDNLAKVVRLAIKGL